MKKIIFVIPIILLLSACGKIPQTEKNIFCMDTVMNIKIYGERCEEAAEAAETELRRLEKIFDRGDERSDVYAVNNGEAVSEDIEKVVETALEISRETDGAFDITVSPIMDIWGFYDRNYTVPDDNAIKNALKGVDYRNVFFDNGRLMLLNNARIDLGGIGKGYASDRLCGIFEKFDISSAIINLGGNVYTYGEKPNGEKWCVGIANPYNSDESLLTLEVSDVAVVTSGSYRRFFERDGEVYHHIVDPKTGKPVRNGIKSVTVVCKSGAKADALSTALFVMGKEKSEEFAKQNDDTEVVIITEDGKVYFTEGLSDCISVKDGVEKEVFAMSKY